MNVLSVTRIVLTGVRFGHVYINITLTFNLASWFFFPYIFHELGVEFFFFLHDLDICILCFFVWDVLYFESQLLPK